MKPGENSGESYRDLLDRAQVFFLRMYPPGNGNTPPGVIRWLRDLEEARTWEAIERFYHLPENDDDEADIVDVPL